MKKELKEMITFSEWKKENEFKERSKKFLIIKDNIILTEEEFQNLCNGIYTQKLKFKKNLTVRKLCKLNNITDFSLKVKLSDTTKLRRDTFNDNAKLIYEEIQIKKIRKQIKKDGKQEIKNKLEYLKSVYEEENNRQNRADEKGHKIIERSSILIGALSIFSIPELISFAQNIKWYHFIVIIILFIITIGSLTTSIVFAVRSVNPKTVQRPRQYIIDKKNTLEQNKEYLKHLFYSISNNQISNTEKNELNGSANYWFICGLIFLCITVLVIFLLSFFVKVEDNTPFFIEKIKEIVILRNYII